MNAPHSHRHPASPPAPACPSLGKGSGQDLLGDSHDANERRMSAVVVLTLVTMVLEISAGYWSGSMALLADGWHMSSHAVALGVSAFAYRYARRHAGNPLYTFGTGKVGDLAAFASSLLLAGVALLMIVESVQRLLRPGAIAYNEALIVAVLGLLVNLASALLLKDGHGHEHDHDEHDHHHDEHAHDDHNLRAAYLHVLADALTSILAIGALLAGRYAGWAWIDPVVGIVGACVILQWAWGLAGRASSVLLDASAEPQLEQQIRTALQSETTQLVDLHLWRLAPGKFAVMVSLLAQAPEAPSQYKTRLAHLPGLTHITVEVESALAGLPET